jgi:hypothetical protein
LKYRIIVIKMWGDIEFIKWVKGGEGETWEYIKNDKEIDRGW